MCIQGSEIYEAMDDLRIRVPPKHRSNNHMKIANIINKQTGESTEFSKNVEENCGFWLLIS